VAAPSRIPNGWSRASLTIILLPFIRRQLRRVIAERACALLGISTNRNPRDSRVYEFRTTSDFAKSLERFAQIFFAGFGQITDENLHLVPDLRFWLCAEASLRGYIAGQTN
jgi:hypothetical protein